MLVVISPAKRMDFSSDTGNESFTIPRFLDQSELIMNKLKKASRKKLSELMSISADLAELNYKRNQTWQTPFTSGNSLQAIKAFKGDVYLGLQAEDFDGEDLAFAQDNLRILSGLHGLIKPLDLVQPYRLEMGTTLPVGRKKNLYHIWNDKISPALNEDFSNEDDPVLINLASAEYFKAVNTESLKARIIKPQFMEERDGKLKFIQFNLKKARGLMTRYIIKNRLQDPETLKLFNYEDYQYNDRLSNEEEWIFTR